MRNQSGVIGVIGEAGVGRESGLAAERSLQCRRQIDAFFPIAGVWVEIFVVNAPGSEGGLRLKLVLKSMRRAG